MYSIRMLGVDIKVRRILMSRSINCVEDLVKLTRKDLLGIVGLGEVYVNQIEQHLSKAGFQLKKQNCDEICGW